MIIPMQENETVIDTWTVIYSNEKGVKYNGKLTVTSKRLLYDAKFDVSTRGLIEEGLFAKWGSEEYIVIPKNRIKQVDVQKSFFAKKAILTLDDDSQHIFNYGMLNIEPVADAIRK
jgi:hypothetical protein